MRPFTRAFWLKVAVVLALNFGVCAVHAETRLALVIGNDEYRSGKLATPANDAGLVADALQAAGFTVTGASNLDQATLRETLREFLAQVSAAGPDAVALVYLSGFGLQFNGENYFIPMDADIARDVDIPLQAIRVSDFTQPLATLPAQAKILILDAARQIPFARGDRPLASGLALVDPVPGMAIAFSAAPGTVGLDEPGPYGAYATALTEMIAAGGLSLDDIFARVRLRVSDLTQGAEVPWYVSQIGYPFFMTERAADAPPQPNVMPVVDIHNRPLRDFADDNDAYAAALALDTIEAYEQFLSIYPSSPYSPRVAAMLAVRREEIVWRRCVTYDTPQAYWSYLRRYPDGPHAWDARRRLAMLRAEFDPPPQFAMVDFGEPPPPDDELAFVSQPILIFAGPQWAPPPPPPVIFLPPRPREFAVLPPPPPRSGRFGLPTPSAAVVPVFVRPPPAVVVRPAPGAAAGAPSGAPGARPRLPISLPNAVQHAPPPTIHTQPPLGAHGAPVVHTPPTVGPAVIAPSTKPPPIAAVKPALSPPPPLGPASPASVKPAPAPPHPPVATPALTPAPPPPHPAAPTPPPPHHPPAPAPTPALTPAPPPPHPPAPTPPPPHHPPAATPTLTPAPPPPHRAPPTPPPPRPPAPLPPPPPHPPAATSPPPRPPPHPAPAPAVAKPAAPSPCPAGKHPTPQGCK